MQSGATFPFFFCLKGLNLYFDCMNNLLLQNFMGLKEMVDSPELSDVTDLMICRVIKICDGISHSVIKCVIKN